MQGKSVVQRLGKQGLRRTGEHKAAYEFVAALKKCSKMQDLAGGMKLHQEAAAAKLQADGYIAANLITMYSKCRRLPLAQQVFDGLVHRDVVIWTCLILGYVENGQFTMAMDLFFGMDCEPSSFTYAAALKACGGLASKNDASKQVCLKKGIVIHKQVKDREFDSNVAVATSLLDMYSKCGSMDRAREVFDRMVSKTVITWTSLILGYVQNGQSSIALELFSCIDCEPNCVTYMAALKACGGLASEKQLEKDACLEKGLAIHKQVTDRGFQSDIVVATTLIDMYSKCGSMDCAKEVFDRMVTKNVVTWTSLILGYAENEQSLVALDLFTRMDCAPNSFTYVAAFKACGNLGSTRESDKHFSLAKGMAFHREAKACGFDSQMFVANTLIEMYSKCGSMDCAKEVFDRMVCKNVVTWTSFMLAYVQNGENLTAMDLFARMDCEPDHLTYVAVLRACGSLATEDADDKLSCLEKGIAIHGQAKAHGLDSNILVASTLVDMYSKCGSMDRAKEIFDRMVPKNVVTWTSLMLGYAQNGENLAAIDLFTRMDCEPDCFAYVAVLKACGGAASLSAGQAIHARLCKHGLEQEQVVANSLLDFYRKCGNMSRTEEVFNNIPSPDVVGWNALITGYSSLGAASQVFNLAKKMQEAGLEMNSVTFTSILSACSHTGLVEEGKQYFDTMQAQGVSLTVEHYNCMVDMLGRRNRLQEALALVKTMPFQANAVTWTTLLGACRNWKNLEVGKVAFDELVTMTSARDAAAFVLMRDIYNSLSM